MGEEKTQLNIAFVGKIDSTTYDNFITQLYPHLTSTTSATTRRVDEQLVPFQHSIWGTTDP
jgi:hypothetical protein